jgi:hypothetical protein
MSTTPSPTSRARSYVYFRIFIGWIGIVFPFVLLAGRLLFDRAQLLPSISDYNYSYSMRNVFVGGLVAIGMLLIAYKYERVDNVASTLAGLAAMGVAFFPTTPTPTSPNQTPTHNEVLVGDAHFAFAIIFFLILAYMALFVFTRPAPPLARVFGRKSAANQPTPDLTPRKRTRNHVYVISGIMIVLCLLLLVLVVVPIQGVSIPALISGHHPVYWLETLAILAFGASWIVKGEVILKDKVDQVAAKAPASEPAKKA